MLIEKEREGEERRDRERICNLHMHMSHLTMQDVIIVHNINYQSCLAQLLRLIQHKSGVDPGVRNAGYILPLLQVHGTSSSVLDYLE